MSHARPQLRPNVSQDAVVVVPGLMGSELWVGDQQIWGFRKLGWYARAWRNENSSLADLALTEEELNGTYSRVEARHLIRFPAFAVTLRSFEPYTNLVERIKTVVAHPDAVREFPYDWRLPIEHNAKQLENAALDHLSKWRSHHAYRAMLRERSQLRPARLIFVAHSMGGLLVRSLSAEVREESRAIIILGSPFDGAAKAAVILSSGEGAPIPLPRHHLRKLAIGLPCIYDLLPVYRCVEEYEADPRRLTPSDIESIGGRGSLARSSFAFHEKSSDTLMKNHHILAGTGQPTIQTISIKNGLVTSNRYTFTLDPTGAFERAANGELIRVNAHGDGTVPRNSSYPAMSSGVTTVSQQHGHLARCSESLQFVADVITDSDPNAPRLGPGAELGIDAPDIVRPAETFSARIVGANGPNDVKVTITNDRGSNIDHPPISKRDGQWQTSIILPSPGIYRVTIEGGGLSPISQLVMADETTN